MIAQILVGLAFGAFFIGLALYQFKNRVLLMGRRFGVERETNPAMVYIFSTLEFVVGLASLGLVAAMLVRSGNHVASCAQRDTLLECSDYLSGWTLEGAEVACPGALIEEQCETDSLYGRCVVEADGRTTDTAFYNGMVLRSGEPPLRPTLEDRRAECQTRGGAWSVN